MLSSATADLGWLRPRSRAFPKYASGAQCNGPSKSEVQCPISLALGSLKIALTDRSAFGPSKRNTASVSDRKTANVLLAVEASRRWADEGVTANAVHPGAVATTNLSRHLDPDELERIKAAGVYHYKSAEQGAATSVLVATSPELDGIGGRYFQDCNEAPVVDPATAEESGAGVAGYAVDPANAERLWQLSAATLN